MKRILWTTAAAAALTVVCTGTAFAQGGSTIRLGQDRQGQITERTREVFGEMRGVVYTLRGTPGERVRLLVRAAPPTGEDGIALDPRVTAAADLRSCFDDNGLIYGDMGPACPSDDDSGGGEQGLDSLLRTTIPDNGRLQIYVSQVGESLGAFTLSATPPLPPEAFSVREIARGGAPGEGVLGEVSRLDDAGRPNQVWRISGRPGETIRIRVSSEMMDPLLEIGTLNGESFTATSSDDDSGPGLNAQISTTIGSSGHVFARVVPVGVDATMPLQVDAPYRIEVLPPQRADALTPRTLGVGASIRGTLTTSDAENEEGGPVQYFRVTGRPGQRVAVHLESDDFDALLGFGTMGEEGFAVDTMNDDFEEGTLNSRLVVTIDEDGAGLVSVQALDNSTGDFTVRAVGVSRGPAATAN